jgi:hypothetical protein
MSEIEQQLHEDRALRNAARRLVTSGLGHVKGDMAQKGLGARLLDRARDGAAEIAENSADLAANNRAQVGTGIAFGLLAFVGWMFRDNLADAINALLEAEDASDGDSDATDLAEYPPEDPESPHE